MISSRVISVSTGDNRPSPRDHLPSCHATMVPPRLQGSLWSVWMAARDAQEDTSASRNPLPGRRLLTRNVAHVRARGSGAALIAVSDGSEFCRLDECHGLLLLQDRHVRNSHPIDPTGRLRRRRGRCRRLLLGSGIPSARCKPCKRCQHEHETSSDSPLSSPHRSHLRSSSECARPASKDPAAVRTWKRPS